jgi:hypothetical protein
MGGIPYSKMTRDKARYRSVCILGNGNAGFEVAQNAFDVAERVTIYGKNAACLSSTTQYTGDVRVKFLQVLENFHGKPLDTVGHFVGDAPYHGLDKIPNKTQLEEFQSLVRTSSWLKRFDCETFVIATGFRSYVPGMSFHSRFSPTKEWYKSKGNPSVHSIGWLMHADDFHKGVGGFLSGYRYLICNLVHHIREKDHNVHYPYLGYFSLRKRSLHM